MLLGIAFLGRFSLADAQSTVTKRFKPELVVQSGEQAPVVYLKFSPDGKMIVSSDGLTMKLWDTGTGRELRTLTNFKSDGAILDADLVRFTRDTRYMMQGLAIIDTYTGKAIRRFETNEPVRDSIQPFVSDDLSLFAAASYDRVDVWSAVTGQLLHNWRGLSPAINQARLLGASYGPKQPIGTTFPQDYKGDGAIHIYSLETDAELLKVTGFHEMPEHLAFSPDGTRLVTCSKTEISVWDAVKGDKIDSITTNLSGLRSIEINAANDAVLLRRKASTTEFEFSVWLLAEHSVHAVARTPGPENDWHPYVQFSPNGKTLAIGDFEPDPKDNVRGNVFVRVLDTYTQKEVRSIRTARAISPTLTVPVAFGPGGRLAVARDNGFEIYDVGSGRLEQRFSGNANHPGLLSLGRDGKSLAVHTSFKQEWWHQIEDGTEFQMPSVMLWSTLDRPGTKELPGSMFFNAPNSEILSQLSDQYFNYHGRYLTTIDGVLGDYRPVQIGRSMNSAKFHFVDIDTEEASEDIAEIVRNRQFAKELSVYAAETSPDGSKVGIMLAPPSESFNPAVKGTFELWDVATKSLIWTASTKTYILGVLFSADGKSVTAGITHLRVSDGKADDTQTESDSLAELQKYGTLLINGRNVSTALSQNSVDLYDSNSRNLIARLYWLNKNDWAVIAPNGLFDASDGAQSLMHFVVADQEIGYQTISLDQLKASYYVPGLLHKLFYAPNDLPKVGELSITLPPTVNADASKESMLQLGIGNRRGGIGRIEVRVNGSEVTGDARAGKNVDASAARASISVDIREKLRAGQNKVEVIPWNLEGNVRGRPAELYLDVADNGLVSKGIPFSKPVEDKKASEVNFYAIVSGIADYQGSGIDLRFAAKDAEDMSKAVTLAARKYFCNEEMQANKPCQRVHVRVLSTESNKDAQFTGLADVPDLKRLDATKTGFKDAFAEVAAKAKPEDVVFVYMSGHGTSIVSDQAVKESAFPDMYLYPTRDASTLDREVMSNPTERDAKAVSSLELASWLADIKADKRVMVLDTCAAGAVQKDLVSQARAVDALQVRSIDRLRERSGFYILMGTAADSQSFEANEYRQGLLTYSLIEAMTTDKGLREGKFLDVEGWFTFAEDKVEELAKNIGGVQKPSFFKGNLARTFDIGRIDAEEQRLLPLAQRVPLILKPELRSTDFTDKEHLSDLLETKLIERSTITIKGEGSPINYIRATSATNGLSPRGFYTVSGDIITVDVTLIRDENPVAQVKVTGRRDEIADKLVEAIVNALSKR
ncbi:MAG TPA: caspase family protein [Pyrinomonadaceae bacterium]|nr:caspase family protein [Pyrinomonadaceae bacterium]